jgi:soluble lytic murein transglycosylase-like protein
MVSPKAAANPADQVRMAEIIDKVAAEQGVEGPLVHSVARVESNYNALAISSKGAQGVMQLEPETARRFGVLNSFDPEQNVRGGVKYLKFLLSYYQGDYTKAVAAYNAGEKAVDRYRGIPPYAETVDYVARVSKNLKTAREKAKKNPPPDAATRTAETYRPIQTSVGSDGRIYYRTP